jgi:hypothetical protein
MRVFLLKDKSGKLIRLLGMPGNLMPTPECNKQLTSLGFSMTEMRYGFVQTHDQMEEELNKSLYKSCGKTLVREPL